MKSPLASTIVSIETGTSCRGGWRPPCPCRPLPLRSWLWGRPGCYYTIYWPLPQLRSTWNNQKDYNLVSWEARLGLQSCELGGKISFDQWFFRLAFSQPGWFWLCGRLKLLAQLQKFHILLKYFEAKWWLVYITSYKRCTAFQWDLQNICMISCWLNTLIQKLS